MEQGSLLGSAGYVYAVGAVLCGLMFLRQTMLFARGRTDRQARKRGVGGEVLAYVW